MLSFNDAMRAAADAIDRWNRVHRSEPADPEYRDFDRTLRTWTFSECCAASVALIGRYNTAACHLEHRDECENLTSAANRDTIGGG